MTTLLAAALLLRANASEWVALNPKTPAPVRFITRSGDRLIGGRVGGNPNSIEVWASTDEGRSWERTGTVAGPIRDTRYGDVCFLSDGSPLVYCAFREHREKRWQVTVCRSTDGGNHWVVDSVVAATDGNVFVGAPALWFSRNGELQCYYDSEKAAADAGRPGNQWIMVASKPKYQVGGPWSGYSVACRPPDTATFARDGMPSVVDLDGRTMMMVCEGVDPDNRARNYLISIKSFDNGKTWDFKSRRVIWKPVAKGEQYNAYVPMAFRFRNGQVGVAFCTDDDFPTGSLDSLPPHQRNAHAKLIRTTSNDFDIWGDLQTIDGSRDSMYTPGLFELPSGTTLATIDFYAGWQTVKKR